MELTKTVKIQIYPTDTQKTLLQQTLHAYTNACNFVSAYVYNTIDLKQASIQKHVYADLRSIYGLPSQMACSSIRTVIAAYKAVIENKHPWSLCKFYKQQVSLVWNKDYSLQKDKFSIGTLTGRIKITYASKPFEHYFDKSVYTFGTAKLVYKHKKFFLHIPVTFELSELQDTDVTNVVGHDRGLRFFVTSYDSSGKTCFYSGKTAKQKRVHYKLLRRQLQQRKTPSARRRLKAIGQRENRWMQDVNHCISKALVTNHSKGTLHVLEDLSGIRSATELVQTKHRYVMVSWAYYDLEQKLAYKAAEHGQKVLYVSPKYTSQTCPKCGHIEKDNRNKQKHIFCCKNCGYQSNDDRIGAMNLYRMGIEYLIETQTSKASL